MRNLVTEVSAGEVAKSFDDLAAAINGANSMWDLRNLNIADLKAGFNDLNSTVKDLKARVARLEAKG